MKPLIGINGSWVPDGSGPPLVCVKSNYVAAVAGAGGVPLVLPLVEDLSVVASQVAACDGFVFVGGPDINPARYGEEPHPTWGPLPECREFYDFALIEEVIRVRKPFLAICLGCQEINVILGGTLIQDIACEVESDIRHSLKQVPYLHRHDVAVEPGSLLSELIGGAPLLNTNSAHHQAVRSLGRGLKASAVCADGIIEAFELENSPFGLSVQWHPEYLQDELPHRRLFEGLIQASSGDIVRRQETPREQETGLAVQP